MILLLGGFSLKVLITTDFYKPNTNGVVRSVMTLKSALEQQGHEVRVLTLNQTGIVRENDVYILRSISAGKIYPNARIMFGMCRSCQQNCEMETGYYTFTMRIQHFLFCKQNSKKT